MTLSLTKSSDLGFSSVNFQPRFRITPPAENLPLRRISLWLTSLPAMETKKFVTNDVRFVISEGEPEPEDKKVLVDGLLAHHAWKGHPRKSTLFSIFVKDQINTVLGGIIVSFLWNGMEIQSLWIDESVRKQNWGSKLVQAVEEEAVKRGCAIAYTNTFSWQAGDFYTKLGYSIYGTLEDFPKGSSLFYLRKNLE